MNFYASAVDQDGAPVDGAELSLRLEAYHETLDLNRKWDDNMRREKITLRSDAAGRFVLTDKRAHILHLESLKKPGFLWGSDGFPSYSYAPKYMPSNAAYANPKLGVAFHLWRKGPTEPLIPVNRRIWLDQETAPNGWVTNYLVNLLAEKNGPATNEFPCDLAIRCWRDPARQPGGGYSCHFEIEAKDGSLCLTSDSYPYLAPTAGYGPTYRFTSDPSDQQSQEWAKNFYLRTRGGKMYGGLKFKFQHFLLTITGYINPFGSRVLEPDPAKLITDPDEIRRLDQATRGN